MTLQNCQWWRLPWPFVLNYKNRQNKQRREQRKRKKRFKPPQEHMNSSPSSSSSPSSFLDYGSAIGQKEVKKILVLVLGLAACLLLYKTAYPLHQELDVNNLTSRPLLDHTSSSSPLTVSY